MTSTTIQFIQPFDVVSLHDFPGAGAYLGGYAPLDVVAFPSDVATDLISRGIAQPEPVMPPDRPPLVSVVFLMERTLAPADGVATVSIYLPGDRASLPAALATKLIASNAAEAT